MDALSDRDERTPFAVTAKAPALTIVVPTFKERENVPLLVARLDAALAGLDWEVVFVDDDSPDGTADAVRDIGRRDARVRVIQRIGRRGLSSACVEGILSSSAPVFAVMDADLQHDDSKLRTMVEKLVAEDLDIVVGSRYVAGGNADGLADGRRRFLSRLGTRLAHRLVSVDLTDPMSGYFVMRRAAFDLSVRRLSLQGFKILLDIFASAQRPLRYAEVPCRFDARQHGESKLDTMAGWEFGLLLLDKAFGRIIPVRFLLFALVGATGIAIHLAVSYGLGAAGASFGWAQTIAVISAMTWNFLLNNTVTYRDRRLRGWKFVRGLASFYAICAVGAVANVGVAQVVFNEQGIWGLAALAGALVGSVWNFAASSYITWRRG